MKKHILKVWMLMVMSLMAAGVWGQAPTAFDPEHASSNVPINKTLIVTFDQSVKFSEELNRIRIRRYSDDEIFKTYIVEGTDTDPLLSISGNILTINLPSDLSPGTKYYVTIGNGAIKSISGIGYPGFSNEEFWNFTTETIVLSPPTILAFDPEHTSSNIPVNKTLIVTFDQSIKFSEEFNRIRIRRYSDDEIFKTYTVEGTDTDPLLSISGNVLTINLPSDLSPGTKYYVTIRNGAIKSISGIGYPGFSNEEFWNFTTESEPIPVDPPYLIENGYSPAPGSVEVPLNPVLTLTFNEDIVKGSSSGYLRIYSSLTNEESFIIPRSQAVVNANVLSVSLSSITLDYNTGYYVLIDPAYVKSVATGADFPGISNATEWTFTTESAPPKWETGYPVVTDQNKSVFTLKGKVNADGVYYYVVTNSPVYPTVEQIKEGKNHSGASGQTSGNGEVTAGVEFSRNSTASLSAGQTYYLYVITRNSADTKYSDIVRIDIDRINPFIVEESSFPANGYSVMPIDGIITLTFSEKVYESGGGELTASSFSIKQGETNIEFDFSVDEFGSIVTLTPKETGSPEFNLAENTTYQLTINSLYDKVGNEMLSITRVFTTDGLYVWTGEFSTDWTVSNNWSNGVFVSGKSVLIPGGLSNYPVISSETISVHNLTIAPGAVLSHSGGTLNVNGLFHLQSSSDVNASYIYTGGILNATADSIRVDQVISNIDLTYIISSPTNSSTAANFGSYYPLYRYDNSKDSWEAIPSAMTPGVGYRMWTDDTMVSFTGSFNTGNIEVSLLRTDGKGYGWNFVGNPYPASIDWTELGITEASSVENAFWMWLPGSRAYGSFSAATNIPINILSSKIPSNHGFLVKVKKELGSGSITFLPEAQVGNSTSYLKSASAREVAPHFKLAGVSSSFRDELAIAFVDEATLGLDKFDMEKKFAERKNIFELYSISGEAMSVINALPSADKIEIPLGYNALQTGDYSIEMLSNSEGNASIVLVDKNLGVETSMVVGSKYDFTINEIGKSSSRFTLKIEKVLTSNQEIKNADNSKAVTVFANDGEIFVNQISAGVFNRYSIVDVQGRLVKEGVLSSAIGSKTLGAFDKGLYIVSFSNGKDKNVMNSKVVVY